MAAAADSETSGRMKRAPLTASPLRTVAPMLPGLILLIFVFAVPLTLILPTSFIVNEKISGSVYVSVLGDPYYWNVIAR